MAQFCLWFGLVLLAIGTALAVLTWRRRRRRLWELDQLRALLSNHRPWFREPRSWSRPDRSEWWGRFLAGVTTRPRKKTLRKIYSKVAGVTFPNRDGTDRQFFIREHCREGVELELIPEADNPYCKDALGVWAPRGIGERVQIGYVPREIQDDVLWFWRAGRVTKVAILDVTGGGIYKNRGVSFVIFVSE